jgi:hypothetical protein
MRISIQFINVYPAASGRPPTINNWDAPDAIIVCSDFADLKRQLEMMKGQGSIGQMFLQAAPLFQKRPVTADTFHTLQEPCTVFVDYLASIKPEVGTVFTILQSLHHRLEALEQK